jgi:4-hydroxy-tetrahydrodipicolinate reductase
VQFEQPGGAAYNAVGPRFLGEMGLMNIVLVGYGRMNRAIEAIAIARGHTIGHRITSTKMLAAADLNGIDMAMEFSTSGSAIENLTLLAERRIRTVAGTTGFAPEALDRVRAIVERTDGAMLWSPNFAIGVHLFWQLAQEATRLANEFSEYDVFVHETHHRMKTDAPSGTGLKTAEAIVAVSERKRSIVMDSPQRALDPSELHLSSSRGGSSPGAHSVTFDSPDDTIELIHTARSRDAFARGAVKVAEWLVSKTGSFTMKDFLAAPQT